MYEVVCVCVCVCVFVLIRIPSRVICSCRRTKDLYGNLGYSVIWPDTLKIARFPSSAWEFNTTVRGQSHSLPVLTVPGSLWGLVRR